MAPRSVEVKETTAARIREFIGKYDPRIQRLARAVRTALRKRLPTANELVYEYADSLVIAYSPTERGIDGIVGSAVRSDGVRLFFNQGPRLPDPKKLLRGSGRQIRYIEMESANRLSHPDVEKLIAAAIRLSGARLPAEGRGQVFIRSDATKRKARGKAGG